MGRKTFRSGGPLFMVGLLFTLVPIGMGFAMVNSLQAGTFTNNGQSVDPNDPKALVMIIGFISIFVVVGLLLCGYSWSARVVVSKDRIRIYNLLGMRTFDAAWSEITDYKRVPGRWANISTQWQIATIKATAKLPSYSDEPTLQRAMIDHLPREVIEAERRPGTMAMPLARGISGKIRSGSDVYGAIFSILWYVFIIFAIMLTASKILGNPQGKLMDTLLPATALVFFAIIPAGTFVNIWKRLAHGSISADQDGIRYTDGVTTFGSPWAKLRFIECRTVTYSNSDSSYGPAYRTVEQLILISGESGIQLDSSLPQFEQIRNMALAYAPPTALVFANDR